ncbi:hypothetical protein KHQ81_09910 [Mycoplasmatota bacterium]|nr:hypothetical protein KHQ81_09910 [Mycoplasmatota bacterium]
MGNLNIFVEECGTSINQACNPNIDNLNFQFKASNGTIFQFTQGRRISLTYSNNTATLIGVIQGSINNGPNLTYNVTIIAIINTRS